MAEALRKKAQEVASAGRRGDRHILHITDEELQALLDTGFITRNPNTGAYEAWSLGGFLGDIGHGISSGVSDIGHGVSDVLHGHIGSGIHQIAEPIQTGLMHVTGLDALAKAAGLGHAVTQVEQNPLTAGALALGAGAGLSELGAPAAAATGTGAEAFPVSAGAPIEASPIGEAPLSAAGIDPLQAAVDSATAGSDVAAVDPLQAAVDSSTGASTGGSTAAGAAKAGGISSMLKNLAVPGAILGLQLFNKPKVPQVGNLSDIASNLTGGPTAQAESAAATSLIPSLSSGILPPGAESMVTNATNDAIGTIKAKYAQMGMSGSTAEAQEIAAAQSRGEAMRFSFAQQATNTGLQAAGLVSSQNASAANIYALIMNAQLQSDQALQNALSNFAFASSLSGALGK